MPSKYGGAPHVGRLRRPRRTCPRARCRAACQRRIAVVEPVGVPSSYNDRRFTCASTSACDLLVARPDVGQAHRRAVLAAPHARSCAKSTSIVPAKRVGDHHGRGEPGSSGDTSGEMRPSKLRLPDSTLASSMSPGHVVQRRQDGARVADAAHASEPAGVEAQRPQALHEPGALEQKLRGLAARGEDASSPTAWAQDPPRRPAWPPGRDASIMRRIGGRRAARHGRDGKRRRGRARMGLAPQLHGIHGCCRGRARAHRTRRGSAPARLRQRNAVVRARRTGERARSTVAQVELDHLGVRARRGVAGRASSPCAFAYASTSATCSAVRPVKRRYSSVASSHGEQRAGACRTPASCSPRTCAAWRSGWRGPARSTQRNEPTTPLLA